MHSSHDLGTSRDGDFSLVRVFLDLNSCYGDIGIKRIFFLGTVIFYGTIMRIAIMRISIIASLTIVTIAKNVNFENLEYFCS